MIRKWITLIESAVVDEDGDIVNKLHELSAARSRLQSQLISITQKKKVDPTPEVLVAYEEIVGQIDSLDGEYEELYKKYMRSPSDLLAQEYWGEHQAPGRGSGSPLWDLTACGTYPKDFYSSMRDYLDEDSNAVAGIIYEAHRRPNMEVKVYRSIPKGLPRKINPGDWVALNKRYVVEHGRGALNNEYVIVTKTVCARDLFTEGNSLCEWGYDPQPDYRGRFRSTRR